MQQFHLCVCVCVCVNFDAGDMNLMISYVQYLVIFTCKTTIYSILPRYFYGSDSKNAESYEMCCRLQYCSIIHL